MLAWAARRPHVGFQAACKGNLMAAPGWEADMLLVARYCFALNLCADSQIKRCLLRLNRFTFMAYREQALSCSFLALRFTSALKTSTSPRGSFVKAHLERMYSNSLLMRYGLHRVADL